MRVFVYQARRGDYREIGTIVAPTRVHAIRRLRHHKYAVITVREIVEPTTRNLRLYDSLLTASPTG